MSETDLIQRVRLAFCHGACRLWRNNVGMLFDGFGRPVKFGLCEGSSDLIGYQSVTITPDMVGQRVAVFVALEGKSKTGRTTNAQSAFIRHIRDAGGIAGVIRSVDDAAELLEGKRDERETEKG